MKKLISLCFFLLMFSGFSCTQKQIVDGIVQLQVMTDVCIFDVSYQITRQPTENTDGEIEFQAILSNSHDVDGQGTVRLAMGVVSKNLKLHQDQEIIDGVPLLNGVQFDPATGVTSVVGKTLHQPYFENPPGTVFKANSFKAYTSPSLVRMAYNKGAKYKISMGKFIPPNVGVGEVYSSCQAFVKIIQL